MDVLDYAKEGAYSIKICSTDIRFAWDKFRARVVEPRAYCKYLLPEGGQLLLHDCSEGRMVPLPQEMWRSAWPVLFETNAYTICITFAGALHDKAHAPRVIHQSREVEEMFQGCRLRDSYLLSSTINFLNQPGTFAFDIAYTAADGTEHRDSIALDVVSPKLDTKTDLNTIIREIKAEYGDLVFRYITLTFQQFELGKEANNELIWLSVFKQVIESYMTAVRYVLHRPHDQTVTFTEHRRAESIKRWSPALEERFAQDRQRDSESALRKHYRIDVPVTTNDTCENRYVKHSLSRLTERLQRIMSKMSSRETSDNEMRLLQGKLTELQTLQRQPFFRTIGRFEGFRQESLVMQQRQGYSQVYRNWLILQNGLDLIEGSTAVSVQPIWKLYELWCFLKVKRTICHIMGLDPHNEEDQRLYIEDTDEDKRYDPFSGGDLKGSVRFRFKDNPDDFVEVGYQYTYDRKDGRINNAASVTVEQRPDIVVTIHRTKRDFIMTYLFDAKYRVAGDDDNSNAVDEPVPDTLNQMHRYRDAIYYGNRANGNFAKEVIGAYILFPGRLNEEAILAGDAAMPYYLKSIEDVNIGAFPLLPNERSGLLLREHLRRIVMGDEALDALCEESVPQKGLHYTDERVTQGTYFLSMVDSHVNASKEALLSGTATEFVSGYSALLSGIDFQKIKYLAVVDSHKVSGFYEVENVTAADLSDTLNNQERKGKYKGYDSPYRVRFVLGTYKALPKPFTYGLDLNAAKGIALSRKEFRAYVESAK